MNFIYTILMLAIVSTTSFLIGSQLPAGNLWNATTTIGIIMLAGATIVSFVSVFQNMYFRNRINQNFNEIKEELRDIKSTKMEMQDYKQELTDSLTKMYPEYEKDLFKSMNPSDAEHISAILIKYPELKFNGVLEKYTNTLSEFIRSSHAKNRNIYSYLRIIENIETSGWMLGSVKKPAFIQKIVDKEFES